MANKLHWFFFFAKLQKAPYNCKRRGNLAPFLFLSYGYIFSVYPLVRMLAVFSRWTDLNHIWRNGFLQTERTALLILLQKMLPSHLLCLCKHARDGTTHTSLLTIYPSVTLEVIRKTLIALKWKTFWETQKSIFFDIFLLFYSVLFENFTEIISSYFQCGFMGKLWQTT